MSWVSCLIGNFYFCVYHLQYRLHGVAKRKTLKINNNNNKIIIIIILTTTMFMMLTYWLTKVIATVRQVHLMNADWAPGGRQLSHQVRLGLSPPKIGSYRPHPQSSLLLLLSPLSWYFIIPCTEGGRLTRPRHCSKCAQPVPKAVCHCGCRDKHNCLRRDSSMAPLTGQTNALITRPLRPCRTAVWKTKTFSKQVDLLYVCEFCWRVEYVEFRHPFTLSFHA